MKKNHKILIAVGCCILIIGISIFFIFSDFNYTSCDGCYGNKTTFDFTKTYEHALIKIEDEWVTVDVEQWNDYEGEQIQLLLKDGTVLLIHSQNCILYTGTLPEAK